MHIENTTIDGLLLVRLDVHGDNRGWFKENWQREEMVAAGLPDFKPVQNNVSLSAKKGATRGLHAEPWDKFISVTTGRAFCAWCDLREGSETYGQLVTAEVGPDTAVFVPRGVANGFQALEDDTAYTYLVTAHWSPDARYAAVNLDMVDWPLEPTEISEKDLAHPQLADAPSMAPRRILVTGANGQLGRALRPLLPNAEFVTPAEFDITDDSAYAARDWEQYSAIINCAAYNDVNGAETDRAGAWAVNALAPGKLARVAADHNLTLVHVSTDYVFDGSHEVHTEDEIPSPLSAYGASKAAGEAAASASPTEPVKTTDSTSGAPLKIRFSCTAKRGSATMTFACEWLMMWRIWSFMSCLLSGTKTAPLHAVPKRISRCSAQFHMSVATRSSPVTPRSSCNACAHAAARAPISANVATSCGSSPAAVSPRHVVTGVAPWTVDP